MLKHEFILLEYANVSFSLLFENLKCIIRNLILCYTIVHYYFLLASIAHQLFNKQKLSTNFYFHKSNSRVKYLTYEFNVQYNLNDFLQQITT